MSKVMKLAEELDTVLLIRHLVVVKLVQVVVAIPGNPVCHRQQLRVCDVFQTFGTRYMR